MIRNVIQGRSDRILFFAWLVGPNTEQGQNWQDDAAEDITHYANQKIGDGVFAKAVKEEVEGICDRVVKSAKRKHDDGEHNADRGRKLFTRSIIDSPDGQGD